MGRPTHRLVLKDIASKTNLEVGVVWPSDFEGLSNLGLSKDVARIDIKVTTKEGDTRKFTIGDKDTRTCFANVYDNKPKEPEGSDDF